MNEISDEWINEITGVLEEEPIRALAREARGFAEEEEEESPHAAAPETRSRIAMFATEHPKEKVF